MEKQKSFGAVLRDILIERGMTTPMGHADWVQFAAGLEGVGYESLRKAVAGERRPAPKIMEAVAAALEIEPTTFWEYELWQVQRQFDPAEVGEDQAFANLTAWLRTRR